MKQYQEDTPGLRRQRNRLYEKKKNLTLNKKKREKIQKSCDVPTNLYFVRSIIYSQFLMMYGARNTGVSSRKRTCRNVETIQNTEPPKPDKRKITLPTLFTPPHRCGNGDGSIQHWYGILNVCCVYRHNLLA